jgi:uncharacterized membrane protein HdeD (DUF308 family)
MEALKTKNWYWILIKGLIMIILGLLVCSTPGESLLGVAIYIGIGLLIAGAIVIVMGIMDRKSLPNWGWTVYGGVLDLFLGYIFLVYPGLSISVIPFMVGFWAAFYGFYLIIDGFSGTGNTFMKVISGILIIILANVIMFNPLLAGMTMMIWFGILLIIGGIYNAIISFSLK